MIARIRKSTDEKEKGFTLIELLVVIIIIGILAAIAIPVFLNQRKKAVDAGIKSDLQSVATAAETSFTDTQAYVALAANGAAATAITYGTVAVPITKGDIISVVINGTSDAYCIYGYNAAGSGAAAAGFTYVSNAGGLKPGASVANACGAAAGAW